MATEKLLPQNVDAEASVLGAVLIDPGVFVETVDILEARDFYREAHRLIYAAMLDLWKKGVAPDLTTIPDELERAGHLEDAGGTSYLWSLPNQTPNAYHITSYAQIVARRALARRLIQSAGQIAALAYDDPDSDMLSNNALGVVLEATKTRAESGFVSLKQALDEAMLELTDRMEHPETVGIESGFQELDRHLGKFEAGELIVLAARPGGTKTATSRQMILNIAELLERRGYGSVSWVTLEMTRQRQARNILANYAQVNTRILRAGFHREDGTIDADKYRKVRAAYDQLQSGAARRVRIKHSGTDMAALEMLCMREVHEWGTQLVVIDQGDLVDSDNPKDDEFARLSKTVRSAKQMAMRLSVPVLLLAQLRRDIGTERPSEEYLRGTGRFEQDADVVLALYRAASFNMTRAKSETQFGALVEVHVLKARDSTKGAVVPLWADLKTQTVYDWPAGERDWFLNFLRTEAPANMFAATVEMDARTRAQMIDVKIPAPNADDQPDSGESEQKWWQE